MTLAFTVRCSHSACQEQEMAGDSRAQQHAERLPWEASALQQAAGTPHAPQLSYPLLSCSLCTSQGLRTCEHGQPQYRLIKDRTAHHPASVYPGHSMTALS